LEIKEKFRRERGEKGRAHIPVWTAVHEINRELHAFCQRTKGVKYFDATKLFSKQNERGEHILLTDYITVRGHPTPEGFKIWLTEVQKSAQNWKIEAGRNHDLYPYPTLPKIPQEPTPNESEEESAEAEFYEGESEDGDENDEESEEGDEYEEEEEESEEDYGYEEEKSEEGLYEEEESEEGDDEEGGDEGRKRRDFRS